MLPKEYPDRWEMPVATASINGVLQTVPIDIDKKSFAVACAGHPTVTSPAELRAEGSDKLPTPSDAAHR
jgi:hypothetical protein